MASSRDSETDELERLCRITHLHLLSRQQAERTIRIS